MQLVSKTIDRHQQLVERVDEFLTQMTAYMLMPSLGIQQDPNDNPLRSELYRQLIFACHNAKSFSLYDKARIEQLHAEIDTLRQWGNKDCTAMADTDGGITDERVKLAALFLAGAKANDLTAGAAATTVLEEHILADNEPPEKTP